MVLLNIAFANSFPEEPARAWDELLHGKYPGVASLPSSSERFRQAPNMGCQLHCSLSYRTTRPSSSGGRFDPKKPHLCAACSTRLCQHNLCRYDKQGFLALRRDLEPLWRGERRLLCSIASKIPKTPSQKHRLWRALEPGPWASEHPPATVARHALENILPATAFEKYYIEGQTSLTEIESRLSAAGLAHGRTRSFSKRQCPGYRRNSSRKRMNMINRKSAVAVNLNES
jgi:hypothetical protein